MRRVRNAQPVARNTPQVLSGFAGGERDSGADACHPPQFGHVDADRGLFYRTDGNLHGKSSSRGDSRKTALPSSPGLSARIPAEGSESVHFGIFLGRLSPEKGVRTLVSAWKQLRVSIPLIIVGEGPLRSELESQVISCGLNGVSLRGRVSREEALGAVGEHDSWFCRANAMRISP